MERTPTASANAPPSSGRHDREMTPHGRHGAHERHESVTAVAEVAAFLAVMVLTIAEIYGYLYVRLVRGHDGA
jgi:hypothetical protein